MTAADRAFYQMEELRTVNPTLAQIETVFKMIRVGDLVHVDLIPAWQAEQDAAEQQARKFDASAQAWLSMGHL